MLVRRQYSEWLFKSNKLRHAEDVTNLITFNNDTAILQLKSITKKLIINCRNLWIWMKRWRINFSEVKSVHIHNKQNQYSSIRINDNSAYNKLFFYHQIYRARWLCGTHLPRIQEALSLIHTAVWPAMSFSEAFL